MRTLTRRRDHRTAVVINLNIFYDILFVLYDGGGDGCDRLDNGDVKIVIVFVYYNNQ